jgi:UDP-N-acetyl-D-glucosamine dehydrogenase
MKKIAVIGLGYVGLPLAISAAKSGYDVVGVDTNSKIADMINSGLSPIKDISDLEVLEQITSKKFRATSNFKGIANIDVFVVCVPTPLTLERKPDLTYITRAVELISPILKSGCLVILESTVSPGTTRDFLIPLVEQNSGIDKKFLHFAYSPERIDPSNKDWGLVNTPKLISAYKEESLKITYDFYSKFIKSIMECSSLEIAETAKLLENSFRLINISFINEVYMFCEKFKIDIREVIKMAATKPFGFMEFYPSLGIGGHCIPIDPLYLSDKAKEIGSPSKFIDLADLVNRNMPLYFTDLAERKLGNLLNKKIMVLGVAYKPNVADVRETPVESLILELEKKGAKVDWHDEIVKQWRGQSSSPLNNTYDLAILATPHDCFDLRSIGSTPLLDTRTSI